MPELARTLDESIVFLRVDYMILDPACRTMFQPIDKLTGNQPEGKDDPDQLWEISTTQSFETVFKF